MRIATLTLVAGLVAGAATAASADTDGWYAGAEAGVNIVPTIRFDAEANTWRQTQDPGYAVLGQVGYGFGRIRLEGELGWRDNSLDKLTTSTARSASGDISALSAMVNAYYDFATGTPITPYIGAGVGGVDVASHKIGYAGTLITSDNDFVFGYQGIAGLSYAVSDTLSLKVDYRYLRTQKASLALDSAYGTGNGSGVYAAHTFLIGFTKSFGAPPPPPVALAAAPVPPPAPPPAAAPTPAPVMPIARSFLVFFDFDKSVITPEAQKIIEQAATAANTTRTVTIQLTGHTDTVGTVAYNMALSLRRGEAVKAALVKLGIPAAEISVVGKGKSEPLVPTGDGVREPQNRRVQILLP